MSSTPRIRTAALVTATVVLAATAIWHSWTGTTSVAFLYWLAACIAGELLWLRLPLGSATISMASCFNFAALLVLTRGEAMLITAISTLAAELAIMRKPPIRATFNAAQTALAVWCASWAFQLAGGGVRDLAALLASFQLVPFVASAALFYGVNRAAVSLAVASSTSVSPLEAWRRNFGGGYELLAAGAVMSLGALLAVQYSAIGMAGMLLVALPLVIACDGMRRRSKQMSALSPAESGVKRAA